MQRWHQLFMVCVMVLTAIGLSACGPERLIGISQQPNVAFAVQGNNPKRIVPVSRENKRCNKRQKRGCIVVGKYNTASILVELRRSKGWRFDRLEICPGGAKRSDTSQHCTLSDEQRRDFQIVLAEKTKPEGNPDANGLFQFAKDAEVRAFFLNDRNTVEGEYFYRVRVCPVDGTDSECIWSDPPIINGGMGSGFF
jgi:hypothetical protein